jgi:hypothetical protein
MNNLLERMRKEAVMTNFETSPSMFLEIEKNQESQVIFVPEF